MMDQTVEVTYALRPGLRSLVPPGAGAVGASNPVRDAAKALARLSRCFFASIAMLCQSAPAMADDFYRLTTPGKSFSLELSKARVVDLPEGRRFAGEPGATVTLRGNLRIPPPGVAKSQAARLIVHFRTTPNGPSLRLVELVNGPSRELRAQTNLSGDLSADLKTNTWDFTKQPLSLAPDSVLRVSVQFPEGFDSVIDPGTFTLLSVAVDFPRVPDVPRVADVPAGDRTLQSNNRPPFALSTEFVKPTIPTPDGSKIRLDWCRIWGSECGKPAADAFCRTQRGSSASSFIIDENIGATAIISSGAVCADPSCDGFARIRCIP